MTRPPGWAEAMRRERESLHRRPETVVAQDADEHRSASRHAPAWWEGRRVGDRIVQEPDLPEWDEPA